MSQSETPMPSPKPAEDLAREMTTALFVLPPHDQLDIWQRKAVPLAAALICRDRAETIRRIAREIDRLVRMLSGKPASCCDSQLAQVVSWLERMAREVEQA